MAATKKAAKKTTRKTTKKAAGKARKPSKKAKGKTLDDFVREAATNEKFVRGLERAPKGTLEKHGYPVTDALVDALRRIDFQAFRSAFSSDDEDEKICC